MLYQVSERPTNLIDGRIVQWLTTCGSEVRVFVQWSNGAFVHKWLTASVDNYFRKKSHHRCWMES